MSAAVAESTETLNYEIHPAATLFPLIEGEAFDALVADIREHGQEQPVVLDADGRLLDGRNRARACKALGVDVRETRYSGRDAFAYVISLNMHRRHLTESQRAMVAARLAELQHGGDRRSQSIKAPDGALNAAPTTQRDAAKALNVSRNSVQRATVVRDHGTPDLQRKVDAGQITVNRAAEMIKEAKRAEAERPALTGAAGTARLSAAERVEQITTLAERGATSEHIAKEIGVDHRTVRTLANRHGVEIRADKVRGKVRRVDHNRVVDNVTTTLETAAFSLRDIDPEQLDGEQVQEWVDSLTTSINALSKAVKTIKESFQ